MITRCQLRHLLGRSLLFVSTLRRRAVSRLKAAAKGAISFLPEPFQEGETGQRFPKGMAVGGTLFEALGFLSWAN